MDSEILWDILNSLTHTAFTVYLTQRLRLTRVGYSQLPLTLNLEISECPKVFQNPFREFPPCFDALSIEILCNKFVQICVIFDSLFLPQTMG